MSTTCCSERDAKCHEEHAQDGTWLLVVGDGGDRRVLAEVWRDKDGGHVRVPAPLPLREHSECLCGMMVRADVMRPFGMPEGSLLASPPSVNVHHRTAEEILGTPGATDQQAPGSRGLGGVLGDK